MEEYQGETCALQEIHNNSPDPAVEEDASLLDNPEAVKHHHFAHKMQQMHCDFRKMENEKRHFHIEAETAMRCHQAVLQNLASDNSALEHIVDTYVIKDYSDQMKSLMESASKFTAMIEKETKTLHKLENKIQEMEAKQLNAKMQMGGCKAGWYKHRANIIHMQQNQNRIQKTNERKNLLNAHIKRVKSKMTLLKQEHGFYDNVYARLQSELEGWEANIQNCIQHMSEMYSDRSEYQADTSDLVEMDEFKTLFKQWLKMDGWSTQKPYTLQELEDSELNSGANTVTPEATTSEENEHEHEHVKKAKVNKKLGETHFAKPTQSGNHYRKWVHIKALANTQDMLKIDNAAQVPNMISEAQYKNRQLYSELVRLLEDLDGIEQSNKSNIFTPSASKKDKRKENGKGKEKEKEKHKDKPKENDQKVQMEKLDPRVAEYVVNTLRHLDVQDEQFVPLLADMKKQVISIFTDAGCDFADDELSILSDPEEGTVDGGPATSEIFAKIENFVHRLIGTFN